MSNLIELASECIGSKHNFKINSLLVSLVRGIPKCQLCESECLYQFHIGGSSAPNNVQKARHMLSVYFIIGKLDGGLWVGENFSPTLETGVKDVFTA